MLAATLALPACLGDVGITLSGSIDDSTLDESARVGRVLRVAAWVGREPGPGVRPDQVTDWKEIESSELNVLNPFFWQTRLHPSATADLWIGAFYEAETAKDGVPAEGDHLAVLGPIAVSSEELRNLEISIGFGDEVSRPTVASVIERASMALVEGDAEAFLETIHPFYSDPMRLDWHVLPAWVAGTFGEGGTAYTTPVSAPLAGFLSPATRESSGMANVAWKTELTNESSGTASATLSYSLATTLGSRLEVVERWLLTFSDTPDDRLISRIHVQVQDIRAPGLHDVKLQTSDPFAADQGIILRWTDTANTLASAYEVTVDQYDTQARVWSEVGASTPGAIPANSSGEYQIAIGTSLQASIILAPVQDAFYRMRVYPIRNGTRQAPSTAFVRGPNYPY